MTSDEKDNAAIEAFVSIGTADLDELPEAELVEMLVAMGCPREFLVDDDAPESARGAD